MIDPPDGLLLLVGEPRLAIAAMIDRNYRQLGRLRLRVGRRLTA